jgi:hypothetical protein
MTEHDDLLKSLEESKEPQGITARSDDGRWFFLTNEDAERMAIRDSRLYTAFRSLRDGAPRIVERDEARACRNAWQWLETTDPNNEKWRRLCLAYFEKCV